MRLDKYLKVSRVIKRRTVANDACDAGHISVNGKVAKASYDVKEGDTVSAGQKVAVLEAMKMENEIQAESAGTVTKIHVAKGDSVSDGTPIVTIA